MTPFERKERRRADRERRKPINAIVAMLKPRVFARDDYKCQYCGARNRVLTVDHKHPLREGGETTMQNLITACYLCNQAKRSLPYDAFICLPRIGDAWTPGHFGIARP